MSTAIVDKSAEDSHMKLVCRAHSNRGDSEGKCSLSFALLWLGRSKNSHTVTLPLSCTLQS